MRFYDGQPVVCINDRFSSAWWRIATVQFGLTLPAKGRRYVVRGYSDGPEPPCVLLREIANPRVPWSDGKQREVAFWDERFVPITDISDLERLLDVEKKPKRRKADLVWDNPRKVPEKVQHRDDPRCAPYMKIIGGVKW